MWNAVGMRITYTFPIRNPDYHHSKPGIPCKDESDHSHRKSMSKFPSKVMSQNLRFSINIPNRKYAVKFPIIYIPAGKRIGNMTFFTV